MTRDATHHPDSPDHESHDSLLAAYALGELAGADRDMAERLLADPAADEARRIVTESRAVAEALRAARAQEAPSRSSDLRRAIVAALAATPAPAAPPAEPRRRPGLPAWLMLAGALAATVLLAVTLVPMAGAPRAVARRDAVDRAAAMDAPVRASGEVRLAGEQAAAKQIAPLPPRAVSILPRQSAPGDADAEALARAAPADQHVLAARSRLSDERTRSRLEAEKARPMESPVPSVELPTASPAPSAPAFGGRGIAAACRGRPQALDGDGVTGALGQGEGDELRQDARDATDRERYGRFEENRFVAVADRPLSTFSIDVDTASYAVARRFLAAGQLPPTDAVRIEEFVNYFPYSYPQPDGDDPFAVALEAADCPWQAGHRLVRIGIAGRSVDRENRPAGNLVFLVDVSGSMDDPDKLPLVKQALAMLVEELTENDRVSIVTYAGDAGLKLPPTSGDQKEKILAVIAGLTAGGSTHGSAGIQLAYEQAQARFITGGANRVILCTDGDLNVGVTSDAALVDLVQAKARGGTFLTVLGFGRGNLQDEKLEAIADKGNGVYAYVDGVREARKVLVEQLTGSTIAIAKDVKIQVEFNPVQVASWRLLGYENRRLADADFRDDRKDAGEIGAGHTVTALYEIVPAGAEAAANGPDAGAEPLTYQPTRPAAAADADGPASRELLTVKLRFKQPEGDRSVLREFPLADQGGAFERASTDTRFASAVAAFGMILRKSEFHGAATLALVSQLALDALGTDPGGHRAEFLDLVRKAELIEEGERR